MHSPRLIVEPKSKVVLIKSIHSFSFSFFDVIYAVSIWRRCSRTGFHGRPCDFARTVRWLRANLAVHWHGCHGRHCMMLITIEYFSVLACVLAWLKLVYVFLVLESGTSKLVTCECVRCRCVWHKESASVSISVHSISVAWHFADKLQYCQLHLKHKPINESDDWLMLLRLVWFSQDIVDAIDVTVPIQILVQRSVHAKTNREVMKIEIPGTIGYLSFVDPSNNNAREGLARGKSCLWAHAQHTEP